MDVTRQQIVAEARTWIGTPFQHGQSCKGKGADCIGLVIGVFRALGCLAPDYFPPPYSQQWHVHQHDELLTRMAMAAGFAEKHADPEPGDIFLFKFGHVCSHVGISLGDGQFIHSYHHLKRVVAQPLTGDLQQRLRKVMICPWVH